MASTEIPTDQLTWIFYHGGHPLWLYLQQTFAIDISDVCARIAKEEPVLKTNFGDLVARVVKVPHECKLPPTHNNDVIFIVNSINTVFESLKEGVEKDGDKILKQYKFALDKYHNMYLVDVETEIPVDDNAIAVVKLD
jgi:hypothetical protein